MANLRQHAGTMDYKVPVSVFLTAMATSKRIPLTDPMAVSSRVLVLSQTTGSATIPKISCKVDDRVLELTIDVFCKASSTKRHVS